MPARAVDRASCPAGMARVGAVPPPIPSDHAEESYERRTSNNERRHNERRHNERRTIDRSGTLRLIFSSVRSWMLDSLNQTSFATRDEQEVAGYARVMARVF